ncbi:MAG: low molecular weight phosphatase family protein, partial [Pseudomonadota bacterium]
MILQSVLIACHHTALRARMAAAVLRRMVGARLYVRSAGVSPRPMDPFMVAVMTEIGIDVTG